MNKKNKTEIHLTMGKWFVSKSDEYELIAPCLGSCIAACLYNVEEKIGGMAHVVFPSRQVVMNRNERSSEDFPNARYADEVIGLLVSEISKLANHSSLSLVAKLAGGAQMFKGLYQNKGFPMIGQSNIQTLRRELLKWNIPLKSCDLGGTYGRTVIFNIESGVMLIRRIGESDYMRI